ncbi:MAG: ATP-grasp domain-containing protein [Gammaproteobacteria bacterium]|nr:ATP-grasp domain-containing protein [Gammaproteobacteria bacterium]
MENVTIKPIRTILVANRGEIASRVFRTARNMGISTVAVYADSDANLPYVREADIAIALKGETSTDTYLDMEKLLNAIRMSGADAVHPGYGFLSENAVFAKAVIDAGVTWIGPPANAIQEMGDKLAAKQLMIEADVPTLPAVQLSDNTDIVSAANEVGYPVLVKAAAGGGGRGMRIVEQESDLAGAIEGARREAAAAFGDDTVFLERWLTSSRHIEMQILGDLHGNVVHFFERECSIQRRHQKIIEEAPSPAVDTELRERMGQAAVSAARSLNYTSAGTVEFLVAGNEFWFLEVNTRLQVEHPVTEEITGFDLVREQIRIAEGEPLGYQQKDLSIDGHAIEGRLYAENPAKEFLPSPGTLSVWKPSSSARFDSGVEAGSEISPEFDPMIAKVISHGATRREAIAKLARALETTSIQGISNNRDFLVAALRTPEFLAGDTTTDFIERVNPSRVRTPSKKEVHEAIIAAAISAQQRRRNQATVLAHVPSGWRNSHMPPERASFEHDGSIVSLEYRAKSTISFEMKVGGDNYETVTHSVSPRSVELTINDRRMDFAVSCEGDTWFTHGPAGDIALRELPRFAMTGTVEVEGGLTAPMPGKVLSTEVNAGDPVSAGQLLVVLEAMKMEHRITAPVDGVVGSVRVVVGDQVEKDAVLIEMSATEGDE